MRFEYGKTNKYRFKKHKPKIHGKTKG